MEMFEELILETHNEFYLFKIANDTITKINETVDTPMQCMDYNSSDYVCHGGCPPLSNRFTCNDDGELVHTTPMCPDIECDSIENIDDGDWRIISTSDGLQVVYNCSDGYDMEGNDTRRCVCSDDQTYNTSTGTIIRGNWSGEAPTCLRKSSRFTELYIPYYEMVDCDPLDWYIKASDIMTNELLYFVNFYLPKPDNPKISLDWIFIYNNGMIAFGGTPERCYPYISGLNIDSDEPPLCDTTVHYYSELLNVTVRNLRKERISQILQETNRNVHIKNFTVVTWDDVCIGCEMLRLQIALVYTDCGNFTLLIYDWKGNPCSGTASSDELQIKISGGDYIKGNYQHTSITKRTNVFLFDISKHWSDVKKRDWKRDCPTTFEDDNNNNNNTIEVYSL